MATLEGGFVDAATTVTEAPAGSTDRRQRTRSVIVTAIPAWRAALGGGHADRRTSQSARDTVRAGFGIVRWG